MSTVTIALPAPPRLGIHRSGAGIQPLDLHGRLRAGRGVVIDLRSAQAYDAAHIPGSLNAADDDARDRLTALLPAGSAVAILASSMQEAARAAARLSERGPDCDVAVVSGGIDRWRRQGLPVGHGLALDARRAVQQVQRGGVALVDVRSAGEFAAAHVLGSISVPLDAWHVSGRELPRLPLVVGASSGELAAAAASVFRAAGHGCVWRIDGGGIAEMLDAGATLPVR
jgi:hydroxyacylglutathione hydrolase